MTGATSVLYYETVQLLGQRHSGGLSDECIHAGSSSISIVSTLAWFCTSVRTKRPLLVIFSLGRRFHDVSRRALFFGFPRVLHEGMTA